MVTTNEPTVVTESLFDPIVMEDSQDNGRLPNPAGSNESDGCQVLRQIDDPLDQLVTSETGPRRRGRRFTRRARCKYKILDQLVAEDTDLV